MVTWNELVEEAESRLEKLGVPEPSTSARWMARQATGTDSSEWLEVADEPASKRQLASFDRMVERRAEGEPLQYVLGSWGFRQLDLFVDQRVLIPRPETEVVAGRAIDELSRVADSSSQLVAADLGTGSGAIGLSLAFERPGMEVWLTDVSTEALQVARANLAGIGRAGGGVRLAEGRWFDALSVELRGRLAVIVSNPPYVASAADLEPQVAAWEPTLALLAEDGGTAHLVELVEEAPNWLTRNGSLVLEMAPNQVDRIMDRAAHRFGEVEAIEDLTGRLRGLVARFPE